MASFNETYNATGTLKAGYIKATDVYIVGVDLPIEEWNHDCWDQARIEFAREYPIDPQAIILNKGVPDPICVLKRKNPANNESYVLCVKGRRRTFGVRAANELLKAQRAEQIDIPFYVNRSDDIPGAIRIENSGRLDDPQWVKAETAAHLRMLGRSDKLIAGYYTVHINTVKLWFTYLDNCPEIQALTKKGLLPMATAQELGKLGKGQGISQRGVLAEAIRRGAQLSGEPGKENIKGLIHALKTGDFKLGNTNADLDLIRQCIDTGKIPAPLQITNADLDLIRQCIDTGKIPAPLQITHSETPTSQDTPASVQKGDAPAQGSTPAPKGKAAATPQPKGNKPTPKTDGPPEHSFGCRLGGKPKAQVKPGTKGDWQCTDFCPIKKAAQAAPAPPPTPAPDKTPIAPPAGSPVTPPPVTTGKVLLTQAGAKLPATIIRRFAAELEYTEADLTAGKVSPERRGTLAVMRVLLGQDAQLDSLKDWPDLHKAMTAACKAIAT